MKTAVDTNVLLDVLIPNSLYIKESKNRLEKALRDGALIICEVVYAELAAQFGNKNQLDRFLQETGIQVSAFTLESLHIAGIRWSEYSKNRSLDIQCPKCGAYHSIKCNSCGSTVGATQHVLADFLIAAHALVQADQLLTRDRGYYQTYFPELPLC